MGYSGTAFVMLPSTFLLMAAILLAVSFAVIYSMKGIVKLSKEEIANEKGTLIPLTFAAWGINVAALSVSFIIMDFITVNNPFFSIIHSEWGGVTPHPPIPEIVYISILTALHGALLVFSYFVFKKWIISKPKRVRFFIAYVISSALLWALFMCYAFRII